MLAGKDHAAITRIGRCEGASTRSRSSVWGYLGRQARVFPQPLLELPRLGYVFAAERTLDTVTRSKTVGWDAAIAPSP